MGKNEIEIKTKYHRYVLCYNSKFILFDFIASANTPTNIRGVSHYATIIHFLTLRLYIYEY